MLPPYASNRDGTARALLRSLRKQADRQAPWETQTRMAFTEIYCLNPTCHFCVGCSNGDLMKG